MNHDLSHIMSVNTVVGHQDDTVCNLDGVKENYPPSPLSHPGSVHQGRVHAGWGLAVLG